MPLPSHAITINGSCTCQAICYQVYIPELSERPLHPMSNRKEKDGGHEVRLPLICFDYCNECRRVTGSILPTWICSPIANVTTSCEPRSEFAGEELGNGIIGDASRDRRGPYIPASAVFKPWPASSSSFLSSYRSSKGRTRFFCGNCGTIWLM